MSFYYQTLFSPKRGKFRISLSVISLRSYGLKILNIDINISKGSCYIPGSKSLLLKVIRVKSGFGISGWDPQNPNPLTVDGVALFFDGSPDVAVAIFASIFVGTGEPVSSRDTLVTAISLRVTPTVALAIYSITVRFIDHSRSYRKVRNL